jgi:hypothetical protein
MISVSLPPTPIRELAATFSLRIELFRDPSLSRTLAPNASTSYTSRKCGDGLFVG